MYLCVLKQRCHTGCTAKHPVHPPTHTNRYKQRTAETEFLRCKIVFWALILSVVECRGVCSRACVCVCVSSSLTCSASVKKHILLLLRERKREERAEEEERDSRICEAIPHSIFPPPSLHLALNKSSEFTLSAEHISLYAFFVFLLFLPVNAIISMISWGSFFLNNSNLRCYN